jgi:energy-coupling factor transport system permease protein
MLLAGLLALCLGLYGLLDGTAPRLLGVTALVVGLGLSAMGLLVAGRRVRRTTYRPDPWRRAEWAVGICGVISAAVMVAASTYDPLLLHPSLDPLRWPDLPVLPLLAVLIGVLPAWLAPRPERPSAPAVQPIAVAA